jgi:hypothetical protein
MSRNIRAAIVIAIMFAAFSAQAAPVQGPTTARFIIFDSFSQTNRNASNGAVYSATSQAWIGDTYTGHVWRCDANFPIVGANLDPANRPRVACEHWHFLPITNDNLESRHHNRPNFSFGHVTFNSARFVNDPYHIERTDGFWQVLSDDKVGSDTNEGFTASFCLPVFERCSASEFNKHEW